jgi:hypothetical protein
VNDIGQIREGEILVCPVTAPSWGPVFRKIKAAVSDIGGTMSHAAIGVHTRYRQTIAPSIALRGPTIGCSNKRTRRGWR